MKIQLLSSIILLSCKNTAALYTINIYLTQFNNPGQTLLNGKYCDKPTRYDQCEHRFQMCLDFPDGNKDDHSQCRIRGPFDINLTEWRVIISNEPWQGDVLMKVFVADRAAEKLEVVDTLSHIITFDAYRSKAEARNGKKVFTMTGTHTRLTLALVVYCNLHWIGPHCDCDATDRRYQCDNDGKKICSKNWFGPECECSQAEGIHDDCTLTETKHCDNDYYGEDCDKHCKSTDDSTGHYICDQNGNKICNKNWCSEICDVPCEELHTITVKTDAGTSSRSIEGLILRTNDGTNPESVDEEMESKTKSGQAIGWKTRTIVILGSIIGVALCVGVAWRLYTCRQRKTEYMVKPPADQPLRELQQPAVLPPTDHSANVDGESHQYSEITNTGATSPRTYANTHPHIYTIPEQHPHLQTNTYIEVLGNDIPEQQPNEVPSTDLSAMPVGESVHYTEVGYEMLRRRLCNAPNAYVGLQSGSAQEQASGNVEDPANDANEYQHPYVDMDLHTYVIPEQQSNE